MDVKNEISGGWRAGPALQKLPQLGLPQLCFFYKAGYDAANIVRFTRNRETSRDEGEARSTQASNRRKLGAPGVKMYLASWASPPKNPQPRHGTPGPANRTHNHAGIATLPGRESAPDSGPDQAAKPYQYSLLPALAARRPSPS